MRSWNRSTSAYCGAADGGHRRRILASEQAWLLARLADRPDLTVEALAVELKERGFEISPNTVWSLLRAAGFSRPRAPLSRVLISVGATDQLCCRRDIRRDADCRLILQ